MSKPEIYYLTAGKPTEYSWKFEIQSLLARFFFSKLPPKKNLYCNLGSGERYLVDFVNADFFQFNFLRRLLKKNIFDKKLDWEIDLRYKLKCKDEFFKGILIEHVLEHLNICDGLFLLKEIKRILKPRGILRISVPDLRKYIDFYNGKKVHKKFNNWGKLKSEAIWSLNHNFGHNSVYDFELLKNLLLQAGFSKINKCNHNKSKDENLRVDDIGRSWESLYVEAKKN